MTIEELDLKIDKLADVVNLKIDDVGRDVDSHVTEIKEQVGELADGADTLKAGVQSLSDTVTMDREAAHADRDAIVTKVDIVSQSLQDMLARRDARIDAIEESVQNAVQAVKCFDEMKGDVALCKAGIRDLDSIRDAFTQSAKGFAERIDRVEESVAAIQTLRHHDDGTPHSPNMPTTPRQDGGTG